MVSRTLEKKQNELLREVASKDVKTVMELFAGLRKGQMSLETSEAVCKSRVNGLLAIHETGLRCYFLSRKSGLFEDIPNAEQFDLAAEQSFFQHWSNEYFGDYLDVYMTRFENDRRAIEALLTGWTAYFPKKLTWGALCEYINIRINVLERNYETIYKEEFQRSFGDLIAKGENTNRTNSKNTLG